MQNQLADLLFFFLCDLFIESKSINTYYKLSFVKTEILSLRFLDFALLSLELLFYVFELFLLGPGIDLFIISLLEFGLLFFHLFIEVMEYFSIVFDFDSVFVEKFFLKVWLDGEDWNKVWSKLGESEKLEILVADDWRDVYLTLDLRYFSLLILSSFLLSRRLIGLRLIEQFPHNTILWDYLSYNNPLLFFWGILELDNFLLF